MFHKGSLLDDPAGLLQGTGRYIREITAEQAIQQPAAVNSLLHSALTHQADLLD